MYILTSTSAVWQEDSTSGAPVLPERPTLKTRWALHPLCLPSFRCVAVRMRGHDVLQVCVQQRDGKRLWRPVDTVMTASQARRWAKEGF